MDVSAIKLIYSSPSLTQKDYEAIAAIHHRKEIKKGTDILKGGQTAKTYALIESGLFRSYVHDYNGREVTTNFMGSFDILIEVSSLFQRIPTQENIEALSDAVVWEVDFDEFQKLFRSIPAFMEWGRAWMSSQLFECKQRSVEMITLSATERYLKLMQQRPDIFSHAPLKQIASYLGVTDTSLSRIRKEISPQ